MITTLLKAVIMTTTTITKTRSIIIITLLTSMIMRTTTIT